MKALNIINPQKLKFQILVILSSILIGIVIDKQYLTEKCTTLKVNKFKSKGRSTQGNTITPTDCQKWLRGLKNSEVKAIRRLPEE